MKYLLKVFTIYYIRIIRIKKKKKYMILYNTVYIGTLFYFS